MPGRVAKSRSRSAGAVVVALLVLQAVVVMFFTSDLDTGMDLAEFRSST